MLIFVLDRKCVIGGGIAIVVVLIVIIVVAVTVTTTEELLLDDVENRSVLIVGYVTIKIKIEACLICFFQG